MSGFFYAWCLIGADRETYAHAVGERFTVGPGLVWLLCNPIISHWHVITACGACIGDCGFPRMVLRRRLASSCLKSAFSGRE